MVDSNTQHQAATLDPQGQAASQNHPRSDADVMAGTEQFQLYQGDMDFGGDDTPDHSDATGNPPAAPQGGTTSQDQPPASHEEPAPKGAEETPKGDKEKPAGDGGEELKFRFKTHEEAERAYTNIFSRTTRAEQRSKELERVVEERTAAERDALVKDKKKEFSTQKYQEAVEQQNELNPDDPDYNKRVATIWANMHQEIADYQPEIKDSDLPQPTKPLTDVVPPPPSGDGGSPPDPGQGDAPAVDSGMTADEIKGRIDTVFGEADPGFGTDDPAFIYFCNKTPAVDAEGVRMEIDDQIHYAVAQTRAHYDNLRQSFRQQTEQPLPRSGPGRSFNAGSNASDDKPVTFSDAIDEAMNSRTI